MDFESDGRIIGLFKNKTSLVSLCLAGLPQHYGSTMSSSAVLNRCDNLCFFNRSSLHQFRTMVDVTPVHPGSLVSNISGVRSTVK